MKMIVAVVLALVAVSHAASVGAPERVETISSDFQQQPDGSYIRKFETSDGIVVEEEGKVKEVFDEENKPQRVVVVRGEYSYNDPEGTAQNVKYFADETGFHAESPSIPKRR